MTTTVYVAYALTGGASTALDYIDGTTLADGDVAFVYAGGIAYQYVLDVDSAAAEYSPDIIAPDANGGDKRWVLQNTSLMAAGGFKNKIIGGDFSTNPWQRGTTITSPSNADYLADRFLVWKSGGMVIDVKKTLDGPTFAQAGYSSPYCLHVDVTTADTSVASGDLLAILQIIEGYNIADLGFGHTDTKYVTLSFWVKATKTGTYCCGIMSADYNAAYIAEYTISASSTWQKVEITIPTESTYGYYDPGSQSGLNVFFTIVAGSDFQNSGNTWIHVGVLPTLATSNQVNGVDSMSNDFKLALIQLEPGNAATPFEFRPAAVERQLCQRYFWRGLHGEQFTQFTTAAGQHVSWPIKFPVTMRDVPTVTYDGETLHSFSDLWVNVPTVDGCRLIAKSSGADSTAFVEFSSSGYIEADAELNN